MGIYEDVEKYCPKKSDINDEYLKGNCFIENLENSSEKISTNLGESKYEKTESERKVDELEGDVKKYQDAVDKLKDSSKSSESEGESVLTFSEVFNFKVDDSIKPILATFQQHNL